MKIMILPVLVGLVLTFQNCGPTEVKLDGGIATTSSVGVSSGTSDQVKEIYNTVFGRLPTAAELAQYTAQLGAGASTTAIRTQLANSPESQANLSSLLSQYMSPSFATAAAPYYTSLLGSSTSISGIAALLQGH